MTCHSTQVHYLLFGGVKNPPTPRDPGTRSWSALSERNGPCCHGKYVVRGRATSKPVGWERGHAIWPNHPLKATAATPWLSVWTHLMKSDTRWAHTESIGSLLSPFLNIAVRPGTPEGDEWGSVALCTITEAGAQIIEVADRGFWRRANLTVQCLATEWPATQREILTRILVTYHSTWAYYLLFGVVKTPTLNS